MAEATNNHSDSARTVDDLFQFLTRARDMRPATADDEILQAFRREQLQLRYHIKGGARKCYSDECAPPQGITGLISSQSFKHLIYFMVEDGHLLVKMRGAIEDYPWEATSFTVENWGMVYELWRAKSPAPAPAAVPAPESPASATVSESDSKMSRPDWIKTYLTEEKKSELADKYDQIGKAAEAVNGAMEADSRVNAFRNPRSVEPFLTAVYPQRRSRK
jgi:hypothetical protein